MKIRLSWLLACWLRAVQGADGMLAGRLKRPVLAVLGGHARPKSARQMLVQNQVLNGMEAKPTHAPSGRG